MNKKNSKNKNSLKVIKLKMLPLEGPKSFWDGQSGRIKTNILSGLVLSFFLLYIFGAYVFAVPPGSKYNPGETLEPNCSPGGTNCTVHPPVPLIDGRGAINTTTPAQALVVLGTSTDDVLGIYSSSSVAFLIVTQDGKVGIATDSPAYILDVYGTSRLGSGTSTEVILRGYVQSDIIPHTTANYILGSPDFKWQNLYAATGTFGSTITVDSTDIISDGALNLTGNAASTWKTKGSGIGLTIESADTITTTSTGATIFGTAGAERMRILTTGEVVIATDTSIYTLDVGGTIGASLTKTAAIGTDVHWNEPSREIYGNTSSAKYKEDITDLEVDSSKVFNLRPTSYTPTGFNYREFGFIAEEVYEVLPELVNLDSEGKPSSVKYSQFGVLLLNEMKKQAKQFVSEIIQAKTSKVEQLEMTDRATKEVYCIWLENGGWVKAKGGCSN